MQRHDIDERIIFIPLNLRKILKTVTFFSEEAQQAVEEYMRKFFSQQSDRLGMPTAIKKILMGHSLRGDVDLSHYDFQGKEELKNIYDRYWAEFRILD